MQQRLGRFLIAIGGLPDEVRIRAAPLLPEANLPGSLTMAPLDDLPSRRAAGAQVTSAQLPRLRSAHQYHYRLLARQSVPL